MVPRRSFARAAVVSLAFGLAAAAPAFGPFERDAQASVSALLSLGELVQGSKAVVVATARERTSSWEEIGGSRRIVTYTRLEVTRELAGSVGKAAWVRTLGGAVGHLGQSVSGEAQFKLDEPCIVFVGEANGALVVAGRAQGHFPVLADDAAVPRLRPSPEAGALIARPGPIVSAREALVGRTVEEAAVAIAQERARR